MNKNKNILLSVAAGVGIAVSFTLIGMSVGMATSEAHVPVKIAECTVEDHKLASFTRERQIGDSIESKIKMKTRILSDIGSLRADRNALKFDIEQAEHKLARLKLEARAAERRALVARGEE